MGYGLIDDLPLHIGFNSCGKLLKKVTYPTPYYLLEHYLTDLGLSLRRLYPGAQYCVRIMRADLAEQDFGFSATPVVIPNFTGELTTYFVDLAGILAFCAATTSGDPDSAKVSRWYIQDRAVNNVLYASQTTAADKPDFVYEPETGEMAIKTDGISQFLNFPNLSWSRNKGYIMHAIVARIGRIDSTVTAALVQISSSATTGTRYAPVKQSATANKAESQIRRINSGGYSLLTQTTDHAGTLHVWTGYADYTNNVAVLRQDAGDEIIGNTVTAGATADTDAAAQYIGRNQNYFLEAYIGEILMWNTNTYAANLENEIELNLIQTYFGG